MANSNQTKPNQNKDYFSNALYVNAKLIGM